MRPCALTPTVKTNIVFTMFWQRCQAFGVGKRDLVGVRALLARAGGNPGRRICFLSLLQLDSFCVSSASTTKLHDSRRYPDRQRPDCCAIIDMVCRVWRPGLNFHTLGKHVQESEQRSKDQSAALWICPVFLDGDLEHLDPLSDRQHLSDSYRRSGLITGLWSGSHLPWSHGAMIHLLFLRN